VIPKGQKLARCIDWYIFTSERNARIIWRLVAPLVLKRIRLVLENCVQGLCFGADISNIKKSPQMVVREKYLYRDLSITRGFPMAWIFGILASCRNLS
jgi:hypothetical protein